MFVHQYAGIGCVLGLDTFTCTQAVRVPLPGIQTSTLVCVCLCGGGIGNARNNTCERQQHVHQKRLWREHISARART